MKKASETAIWDVVQDKVREPWSCSASACSQLVLVWAQHMIVVHCIPLSVDHFSFRMYDMRQRKLFRNS